ncbi:aspartyl protease family protein [Spirosoma validum]|uniref:Retropepsin-like domain-containing protein n=1 Tax=Spirosoma validum TaxID=2771355 RepID=A0A927GDC6_9BACT|nr:aspartyl protease family protein [Spirosoma validum]MBD2753533.1 retropepsin-like domain-containing protein [Spirosoma validum]
MLRTFARAFVTLSFLFSELAVGQSGRQTIPFTIRENLIYVAVHINGHGPYQFRLDSGVSGIGRIDYRVAKELQLNIVGFQENTSGDQVKREILVAVDKLSVGSISHSGLKLVASDYKASPKQAPIDGVIGRDFFYNYLLTIDGPAQQLLVSHEALDARAGGVLSYQKPFVVTGKIGQKDLFFSLDTGSDVSFHVPMYLLTGIHYVNTPNQRIITMANTTFTMQEALITDELRLGNIKVSGQKVYYSNRANQVIIGEDFLKEHILTIDQRRKLIRID